MKEDDNTIISAHGTAGSIAAAVIIVAFCAMVVGACWAGAWMFVGLAGK